MNENMVRELQDVVIRFSGDSGDGMQLTGTLFSDTSALLGNGISTFPDYPAEIRAPQEPSRASRDSRSISATAANSIPATTAMCWWP